MRKLKIKLFLGFIFEKIQSLYIGTSRIPSPSPPISIAISNERLSDTIAPTDLLLPMDDETFDKFIVRVKMIPY